MLHLKLSVFCSSQFQNALENLERAVPVTLGVRTGNVQRMTNNTALTSGTKMPKDCEKTGPGKVSASDCNLGQRPRLTLELY